MHQLDGTNETRSMMKGTYNDTKLDKSNELNSRMSIAETGADEFENTIHSIGGNTDAG